MTITLPERLAAWVAERAARLGYASADELVAELVERESRGDIDDGPAHLSPANQEELNRLLEEGIESGPPILGDDAFWAERHRLLAERTAALNQRKQP